MLLSEHVGWSNRIWLDLVYLHRHVIHSLVRSFIHSPPSTDPCRSSSASYIGGLGAALGVHTYLYPMMLALVLAILSFCILFLIFCWALHRRTIYKNVSVNMLVVQALKAALKESNRWSCDLSLYKYRVRPRLDWLIDWLKRKGEFWLIGCRSLSQMNRSYLEGQRFHLSLLLMFAWLEHIATPNQTSAVIAVTPWSRVPPITSSRSLWILRVRSFP